MIPRTILVVAEPFPGPLSARRVAAAIARGLQAVGQEVDCHPRENPRRAAADASAVDTRAAASSLAIEDARAVVLADHALCDGSPPTGAIFEIATRARQGGVPAYGITAARRPDLFQARMLDLQAVLSARGERSLARVGRELGAFV